MENTILLYILKVNIAFCVLYGFYFAFLKGDTFFQLKRIYFLSGMFLSFIYPFIPIDFNSFYTDNLIVQDTLSEVNLLPIVISQSESIVYNSFSWTQILLFFSSIVSLVLLAKLLLQCFSIIRFTKRYTNKEYISGTAIINVEDKDISPFSFFKWIYINKNSHSGEDLSEIIIHEKVHANHYHSVDTLFSEISCVLFWWNPFVWKLKKELKVNLEFIADREVLNNGVDIKKYQYHLLKLSTGQTMTIANKFNINQLKKRIMMMNTQRTIKSKVVKYLFILPAATCFLLGVSAFITSCSNKKEQEQKQEPENINGVRIIDNQDTTTYVAVEVMPEYAGGQGELMKFIQSNLKYPETAAKNKVEGRVIARFVVSNTGEVKDVEILKGLNPECDAEALRVISLMKNWTPGKQNGKPVNVFFTIPILFKLEK